MEQFCKNKGIEFKFILLLDNSLTHPKILKKLHPKIKVVFLPPNTTSLIQPLDQGVIQNFKLNYMKNLFSKIHNQFDKDSNLNLRTFWKKFNLFDAIQIIKSSWKEIKFNTLKFVWIKIWPEYLIGENNNIFYIQSDIVNNIINNSQKLSGEGFNDMNQDDIVDFIDNHYE